MHPSTAPFVPGSQIPIKGRSEGPLAGLTFAAKDLFDVAGRPTGGGNHDWARWYPVPDKHAWAVGTLLDAGATLIGSYETVRVMEAAGIPLERMICVSGGERVDLGHGVTASVFPSLHSCVWSQVGEMHQPDHECIGDLGLTLQEQGERMATTRG